MAASSKKSPITSKISELLTNWWNRTSTQKLLLLFGIISISALVSFTAGLVLTRSQAMINRSVEQFGLALAHALARGGAEALSNSGNMQGLRYYVLTEMGQTPALAYIAFTDTKGNVLLDSQAFPEKKKNGPKIYPIYTVPKYQDAVPGVYPSPEGYREITNVAVSMRRNGKNLGVCWVGLDNYAFTILGAPEETKYFLMSVFFLVWLLGGLGLVVNYALINRPLRSLAKGASRIAAGKFGYLIRPQRAGKEIDQLVTAFNYMSNRLMEYDRQNVDILMSERNKFRSERNKLELVLMSIADGVVVCDRDNRVQIVNAAAKELFDKEEKELVGKPLVFCTEGPDSPAICNVIQAFTDSVTSTSLEPVVQMVHRGQRIIRLHISPIVLDSKFLGSVMIMQDITRQAELERMKNEFISNVSHELRTPITSIKSYVDTICNHGEKLESDIYREFLQTINKEADKLMYLVGEVLELSRQEEAGLEMDFQPHDLGLIVEYALRSVKLLAKDKGVALEARISADLPLVVVNQESIERAILNLVTNALKYTNGGGTIIVSADLVENDEIRICVKDNGIGIPPESLPYLFDRFYRVEAKVHTIAGTGLGLTIVKRIVEKHKGRITVDSVVGEGTTFTIHLPVSQELEVASDADSADEPDDVAVDDLASSPQ